MRRVAFHACQQNIAREIAQLLDDRSTMSKNNVNVNRKGSFCKPVTTWCAFASICPCGMTGWAVLFCNSIISYNQTWKRMNTDHLPPLQRKRSPGRSNATFEARLEVNSVQAPAARRSSLVWFSMVSGAKTHLYTFVISSHMFCIVLVFQPRYPQLPRCFRAASCCGCSGPLKWASPMSLTSSALSFPATAERP